jgi:hypothetical protein
MKSEYDIIDNALSSEQFDDLVDWISSNVFPWYHQDTVAYDNTDNISAFGAEEKLLRLVPLTESQKVYNFALMHRVFENEQMQCSSETWQKVLPILGVLGVESLIRIKINYYPRTPKIVHHKNHRDLDFKHKGAIFYLNESDGLTVLEDGTEIESVPNRLVLFDSSRPHHSTTTTNTNRRLNINFNYM